LADATIGIAGLSMTVRAHHMVTTGAVLLPFFSPPRHNFTSIPRIRSERPAFDLHYPHIRSGRPPAGPPREPATVARRGP
jgi:hypothetical protein